MLTLQEREEISRGLAEGLLYKEIGVLIGRDPSIISRDVARHDGRVVGRTDILAAWLIDVKPHVEAAGEIDQWQRLVDALVVAGNKQLAPHST